MPALPPPSLRRALQEATDRDHRALEALPFFLRLREGKVEGDAWLGYLAAMRVVYGALDEVRPDGIPPFPLHALAQEPQAPPGTTPVARIRAQILAHRIRSLAQEDRAGLLGALYVLEGASLGARVLAEGLRNAGSESPWLTALAARGEEGWSEFLTLLAGASPDPDARSRAVEGARAVFRDMGRIGQALHPVLTQVDLDLASELNPHAGGHPVAAEEEVLEAAFRAGEHSWARWPYYRLRYGERGRAFTRSDSAWLATLAGIPLEGALEQVLWLANLLTSRGMPRLLMEEHLRLLHAELEGVAAPGGRGSRLEEGRPAPAEMGPGLAEMGPGLVERGATPADRESVPQAGGSARKKGESARKNEETAPEASGDPWAFLLHAADLLRSRRTAWVSERASRAMARTFDARVPNEEALRLPRSGLLLAAALADEADGLSNAVSSLESWLSDRALHSAAWSEEVQRTIRRGRSRLRRQAREEITGA